MSLGGKERGGRGRKRKQERKQDWIATLVPRKTEREQETAKEMKRTTWKGNKDWEVQEQTQTDVWIDGMQGKRGQSHKWYTPKLDKNTDYIIYLSVTRDWCCSFRLPSKMQELTGQSLGLLCWRWSSVTLLVLKIVQESPMLAALPWHHLRIFMICLLIHISVLSLCLIVIGIK